VVEDAVFREVRAYVDQDERRGEGVLYQRLGQ